MQNEPNGAIWTACAGSLKSTENRLRNRQQTRNESKRNETPLPFGFFHTCSRQLWAPLMERLGRWNKQRVGDEEEEEERKRREENMQMLGRNSEWKPESGLPMLWICLLEHF